MADGTWHDVFDYAALEEGIPECVAVNGVRIALFKVKATVYATSAICSHAEANLCDGYVEDDIVECPIHQARFHIPTGRVLSEPATTDIGTYPVDVRDRRIFVRA